LDSEKDYEDDVKFFVLNFLLGENLALDRFDLNDGEHRKIVDHLLFGFIKFLLFYIVGIYGAFLIGVIPEINLFILNNFFDEYSTGSTVVKNIGAETIRQGRIFPSDTDSIITVNKPVIIDEWEKLDNIASSSLI